MCKLVSKCCVCGKVYAVTTCTIRGQSKDAERVSHGYCSPECSNNTPVQIMVWSNKHGMFVLERAYMVGEKLFFNGEFKSSYVSMGLFPITLNVESWSEEMGFYEEYPQVLPEAKENKLATIKEFALKENLVIKM